MKLRYSSNLVINAKDGIVGVHYKFVNVEGPSIYLEAYGRRIGEIFKCYRNENRNREIGYSSLSGLVPGFILLPGYNIWLEEV